MAESDILIIPQDQTVHTSKVNVTEAQQLSAYKFDAVLRYRTRHKYKPTRHPVPSGSNISDHVSTAPISFQLVGVITPYNDLSASSVAAALAGSPGADTDVIDVIEGAANTALELARRKRDQFIQYGDEHTLLTVMSGEFQHANMVVTSVDDPKTTAHGDSYELTVSFEQIRVPLSSSRIAPVTSEDADKLGSRSLKDIAGRN